MRCPDCGSPLEDPTGCWECGWERPEEDEPATCSICDRRIPDDSDYPLCARCLGTAQAVGRQMAEETRFRREFGEDDFHDRRYRA